MFKWRRKVEKHLADLEIRVGRLQNAIRDIPSMDKSLEVRINNLENRFGGIEQRFENERNQDVRLEKADILYQALANAFRAINDTQRKTSEL